MVADSLPRQRNVHLATLIERQANIRHAPDVERMMDTIATL